MQECVLSTDRRSVRTRRALRLALAQEISATGDLSRVTVTAVTERAGVTRRTFYSHFKDIPDLVMNAHLLNDGGVFVLEHGKTQDFSSHPCFVEHRAYGSVNFTFFKDSDSESAIPASDEDKNGTQG